MAEINNKNKFLNYDGLAQVWGIIQTKIETHNFHTEKTYTDALLWATGSDKAAVGQVVYIEQQQTIHTETGDVKYLKGLYVVDKVGDGAILSPIACNAPGEKPLYETVQSIDYEVKNNIYKKNETYTKQEIIDSTTSLSNSDIDKMLNLI